MGPFLSARAALARFGVALLVTGGIFAGSSGLLQAVPALAAGGTWVATGSMATARHYHTATLLPGGKVLVAGGDGNAGILASAELYDPVNGTWSATGSMATAREVFTATLLASGKVLVAGGFGNAGLTASAELYDPVTGTWTSTGGMALARTLHSATLLPSGKVLVAGGSDNVNALASAELYDPVAGTWSATGSMATARSGHTATLLPSGKVLVAAGSGTPPGNPLASAELYDPVAGTWSATGSMATARFNQTATLLTSGKVLVAGGYGSLGAIASAELYDPLTGIWSATGSMANARSFHTATLLTSGKVLVAGGAGPVHVAPFLASVELYDPLTGTWSATGSLVTARIDHTANLLLGGQVLVAGGEGFSGLLASAELYTPETLPPATVVLSPASATNPVGTSHTVTATVTDVTNQPVPNATVQFTVTGSVSTTGACTTNTAGQCSFTYQGPTMPGQDHITGCAGPNGSPPCGTATKTWVCGESDGNGNFQGNHGNGDFEMDNDNCEETGHGENGDNQGDQVQSSDRGDHQDFRSTKVESTKFDAAANTVTITGQGVSGGNPVSFTLVALETGDGVPGWVSMTFSDGFTNAGNLVTGSITLR